jgi:ubiquinone/menaquinone biosynthesis C-methylase UbiE
MINDSKGRFSKTVKVYDKYRPSYPQKLVDWIVKISSIKKGDKIADVGCGTGISSRIFAENGFKVIGIDPNKDMLKSAQEKKNKLIHYQIGDSEHTDLKNKSVDLAIAAQAFHWFDIPKTNKELKRILKDNGYCCAFWNSRRKTNFVREYEKLLKEYSDDYMKTPGGKEAIVKIKKFMKNMNIKQREFLNPNVQIFDLKGLIGRAYSTSYVTEGVKRHNEFRMALTSLFNKYKSKGKVKFGYKTFAICWQP